MAKYERVYLLAAWELISGAPDIVSRFLSFILQLYAFTLVCLRFISAVFCDWPTCQHCRQQVVINEDINFLSFIRYEKNSEA